MTEISTANKNAVEFTCDVLVGFGKMTDPSLRGDDAKSAGEQLW